MLVLRTPKGWTGPKTVDGKQTEGSWRSHQVPLAELATKPGHLKLLEKWLKSYKPDELFDKDGALFEVTDRAWVAETVPGDDHLAADGRVMEIKKADVIRVYLPPDANTLLAVTDKCLRSRNLVNVIVAGKQMQAQWLTMDAAVKHCAAGIGMWEWACSDAGGEPDVVLACAGDVPTLETLAATELLRQYAPELKVRVVNIVDLMTLQPKEEHSHGLSDRDFDALFTTDKPIIFAYHGYPWLIHRLTYRRTNHPNLHVRGYKEEGTTTTPFDMVVRNDLDRFHLLADVFDRVPKLRHAAAHVKQVVRDKLVEHRQYITRHGIDLPGIANWRWVDAGGPAKRSTAAKRPRGRLAAGRK